MRRAALLAPLLLAAAPAPPLPPEKPAGVEAPAAPPPASPDTAPLPPYEAEVERLAGLMGTLSFMRELCGASDGPQWRAKMQELLAAEGSTDIRRKRLAGAFNEGQRGYAATYRQCTPAAGVVIDRALNEAARLTRDLSDRYGG